jgi:hypothetical protein
MILKLTELQNALLRYRFNQKEIDRPKIVIGDEARNFLKKYEKDGMTTSSKKIYLDDE